MPSITRAIAFSTATMGSAMPRIAAALAMLAASVASFAAEGPSAELALQRARWAAAGLTDYVYGYNKHCDCYRETPPETVVTVTGGIVTRVHHVHADSPREVPAREGSLDLYWTIEDLFALIESAMARDAVVRARYDETLGYPTAIYIDYDAALVGDELDLRITRVRRSAP
jgi:hypothetical protein